MKACFVFFLSIWTIAVHAGKSAGSESGELQYQTETGFDLTGAAAASLLSRYPFVAKPRDDFYVDIYDGNAFLLIPSAHEYKFRMQTYKDKAVLQTTEKLAFHSERCLNGAEVLPFIVKEKLMGEKTADKRTFKRFAEGVSEQLVAVEDGSEDAAKRIRELHEFVLSLDVPRLSELMSVPSGRRWYFVASHITRKVKWKLKVDYGYGPVEIALTEGRDFAGKELFQRKYEIEFQPDGHDMSVEKLARTVCTFAAEAGLSAADVSPGQAKPQDLTLSRLAKIRGDLGFEIKSSSANAVRLSLP
ncbi:MAG: hypothetical protein HC902_00005, partial [Calothrix sp. SM1_5_4]|nr:hypothetical protein [Calothrix sp. SM1_5_4]